MVAADRSASPRALHTSSPSALPLVRRITSRPELGLTVLRVTAGFNMFTHGVSKLFLHVQGPDSPTFVEAFVPALTHYGFPFPAVFAWSVAILEFGGGLAFISGLLVRPLAAYYIVQLTLGIVLLHGRQGWYTVGPGRNGAEYSVLLIAAMLTLIVAGHGYTVWHIRRRAAPAARDA